MLEPEHKTQIEQTLGRSLTPDEMVEVDDLNHLSPAQRHVANALATQQLVLCTLYLRGVADVTLKAATRFVDQILSGR